MQIGILRGDFSGFAAITGVYCKEQLAEYFGYLPAVDLVNNISGSADFASFSIIAPNLPAEFSNWNTLLVVFSSSLLGLLLGYLLDRFWYKYL